MGNNLGYGKQLSCEEYDAKIVALYSHASPMLSKLEDAEIREQELNLRVDYRLGVEFSSEKRERLWLIMQRIEKKRLWLALKYGFQSLVFRKTTPKGLSVRTNRLAQYLVDEFSGVLNVPELKSYFELNPEDMTSQPDDIDDFNK